MSLLILLLIPVCPLATTISTCASVTENWPQDTNVAEVGCPQGETIQQVLFASFGTSQGSCGTQPFVVSSCNAVNSTAIVQKACLNANACGVPAALSLFGDPCPNVNKWLSIVILCTTSSASLPLVFPGTVWNDTSNNRIEAHGGGFMKNVNDNLWYWYGENQKTNDLSTHGINCYTSTDLSTWKFVGEILSQKDITGIPVAGPYVIERPKVVYCSSCTASQQYVLWFHLDSSSYSLQYVGVATAPTASGPFTFVRGFQPDGLGSLDMGMYQEMNSQGQHDGPAYLVRSVENQYVGISGLSANMQTTTGIISTINEAREGQAIFKRNGLYYMITSHLTGWSPNPMEMFVTGNSLNGAKWTSLGNPTGDSTTFNSQSTFVIPFNQKNTEKQLLIYAGDRWNYPDLLDASYIWLPIEVNTTGTFFIPWQDQWELNAIWPGELAP